MNLHEQISRLLDDALDPEVASALRARIASDPTAAKAMADVQRATQLLETLPDEAAPPWLDGAILDAAPHALRPPARPAQRWIPWAIALAASAAWYIRPPATPVEIVAGAGHTWVDGPTTVYAAKAQIDVDGTTQITVEPSPILSRVPTRKEPPMNRSHLLSATAGATVAVAVISGTAIVRSDAYDAPVTLHPGETLQIEGATPPPTPPRRVVTPVANTGGELAALRAENTELRDLLQRSEIVQAVTAGQLATFQGEAMPWPENLETAWLPPAVRDSADRTVADDPTIAIDHIDCDEFPCVAVFTLDEVPEAEIQERARLIAAGMRPDLDDDDAEVNTTVMISRSDDGETSQTLLGVAVGPGDEPNEDLAIRTRFRAEQALRTAEGPLREETEGD